MPLTARDNRAEFEAGIDAFINAAEAVAAPRILNKLSDQASTAGFRKVAELYKVGPRTMQQYASAKLATASDLRSSTVVKGRAFPMSVFQPRQTRSGVTVNIKGKRVLIPHAFLVKRFGSHVFARGGYGGKGGARPSGQQFGRFLFGRGRLPIQELFTFGPVEAFQNVEVIDAMNDRVQEQAAKVAAQEIRFATRQ